MPDKHTSHPSHGVDQHTIFMESDTIIYNVRDFHIARAVKSLDDKIPSTNQAYKLLKIKKQDLAKKSPPSKEDTQDLMDLLMQLNKLYGHPKIISLTRLEERLLSDDFMRIVEKCANGEPKPPHSLQASDLLRLHIGLLPKATKEKYMELIQRLEGSPMTEATTNVLLTPIQILISYLKEPSLSMEDRKRCHNHIKLLIGIGQHISQTSQELDKNLKAALQGPILGTIKDFKTLSSSSNRDQYDQYHERLSQLLTTSLSLPGHEQHAQHINTLGVPTAKESKSLSNQLMHTEDPALQGLDQMLLRNNDSSTESKSLSNQLMHTEDPALQGLDQMLLRNKNDSSKDKTEPRSLLMRGYSKLMIYIGLSTPHSRYGYIKFFPPEIGDDLLKPLISHTENSHPTSSSTNLTDDSTPRGKYIPPVPPSTPPSSDDETSPIPTGGHGG